MQTGYLDFHTHILPGVDDGAVDMEMTRAMLEKAYAEGVRTIIASSHAYPGKESGEREKRLKLIKQVNELAKSISSEMQVLPGNEIYYRESMIKDLEEGKVFTQAMTKYVLVEFRPTERYERIHSSIRELIDHGYYPVIAHVERIETLINSERHMKDLVEMSCYMQTNAKSLMGGVFDKRTKTLIRMIGEGRIHFIGSDCHDPVKRPPLMEACVKKLYKKLPKEVVDKVVFRNQELFLQNKYL